MVGMQAAKNLGHSQGPFVASKGHMNNSSAYGSTRTSSRKLCF